MGVDLSWLNGPMQIWFKDFRLRAFPLPPALDCQTCSKSQKVSGPEKERWRKWKCCTFQPFVPNFLLGAILKSGKLPLQNHGVFSPLGLCPTLQYREKYFATPDGERGLELICSFYDPQKLRCTVWENRPSECSVFYCETTDFFSKRSQDLFEWEMAVAQMALVQTGYDNQEIAAMTKSFDDADPGLLENCWAHHRGRESDFYLSCWAWAQKLSGHEIFDWLSEDVQARFDSWIELP